MGRVSDAPTIGFLKADVARFCAGLDTGIPRGLAAGCMPLLDDAKYWV